MVYRITDTDAVATSTGNLFISSPSHRGYAEKIKQAKRMYDLDCLQEEHPELGGPQCVAIDVNQGWDEKDFEFFPG